MKKWRPPQSHSPAVEPKIDHAVPVRREPKRTDRRGSVVRKRVIKRTTKPRDRPHPDEGDHDYIQEQLDLAADNDGQYDDFEPHAHSSGDGDFDEDGEDEYSTG